MEGEGGKHMKCPEVAVRGINDLSMVWGEIMVHFPTSIIIQVNVTYPLQ